MELNRRLIHRAQNRLHLAARIDLLAVRTLLCIRVNRAKEAEHLAVLISQFAQRLGDALGER